MPNLTDAHRPLLASSVDFDVIVNSGSVEKQSNPLSEILKAAQSRSDDLTVGVSYPGLIAEINPEVAAT
ncbi:hypothetical protein ABIB56_003659 [Glaciihabitans sp. UYNi722]